MENEKTFDRLIGMFSDGKLSIDSFLAQKRLDTEHLLRQIIMNWIL
jgi:hypothetical protein